MRSLLRRGVVVGLLGVLLASGLAVAPPMAREVRAATPDLTLVGDARYDVQPQNRRVRVTVDLVATNHLQDTVTRRFYFDRALLQVLPGTSGFRLTSSTGSPSVRTMKKTADYTILQLTFGQRIFSGKSASFQLRFDLPDPGGRPARDVRIGTSLVSFPAWGVGSSSTPGGSVSVTFPAGYTIEVFAGPYSPPTTDTAGRVTYASGPLTDAVAFSSFFVADRPASYVDTKASATVGATSVALTIRSWPDDPAWGKRVTALFERGLPVLAELTGLPWTRTGPLVVQETVSRTTGGYAGLFDPAAGRIEVAYYADSFVILHEATHSWFNGALLADRWANEAFASYYALAAAGRLKEKATSEPLTAELRKARIPLNAWGAVGTGAAASEDYAYAASLALAVEIGKRAGADGLRKVWTAAAAHEGAYQPAAAGAATASAVEPVGGPPDWRGLLDLLEDRTEKHYDDLWREWVVRDAEGPLLEARATARTAYDTLVEDAGTWQLPGSIRAALRAWQFDQASELMSGARAVLARRVTLEAAARDAGLVLPPGLEAAFESADGVAAAQAEADAEAATIAALISAQQARPAAIGPLEQIGLLGQSPDQALASARQAFANGDLRGAAQGAMAASSAWIGASDAGLNRVLTGIAILLVLLAIALLIWARRDRRWAAGN